MQTAEDEDELDDVDVDDDVPVVVVLGSSGSPEAIGKGFDQGPVQPGGRMGCGVIPPGMPTSPGMQPEIDPPPSRFQILIDGLHKL